MGAMNSIHQKLKEFSDAEESSDHAENSTPQRVYRQKCLSNIDPRSPTENIDRTPIIVDGTPITHLSKGVKSRIAIQTDGPVDPRSPSIDFTRTPLGIGQTTCNALCDTPLKASSDFVKPVEETKEADLTSVTHLPETKVFGDKLSDAFEISTPSTRVHSNSMLSTDSSLNDESFDTAPLLESTEKLTMSTPKGSKKNDQEAGTDESLSLQTKLKSRSMNKVLNQHTSVLKPRSPLSLVDNSPRIINAKKPVIADKSDYVTLANSALDKENICH